MHAYITALLIIGLSPPPPSAGRGDGVVSVTDTAGLRRALIEAGPGTKILVAPGEYEGGLYIRGLRGEPDRPIVVEAADPDRPPVFRGGGAGIQLSEAAYVELRWLVVERAEANGISIDDGGTFDTPAHHVALRNLIVRDVGPDGNRDGIKLSGVEDFTIENCTVERWGSAGSGIDMVGCRRGTISGSIFRHRDGEGHHGVQAKGGSREITVTGCRFEDAGLRAVNIGGSTGMAYFRPEPQGFEAKDITVEDCTFIGSQAPIAFVGVDGAVVRHNTIYRPRRNVVRILQETRREDFVPSRNGRFTDNLIVYRRSEIGEPINVGPGTAPESFVFARNAWYAEDAPARSQLTLPVTEARAIYGVQPQFVAPDPVHLRVCPGTPLERHGVRPAVPVAP